MNLNKLIICCFSFVVLTLHAHAADPVKPDSNATDLLNDIPLNNPFGGSAASTNDPANNGMNQNTDGLAGRVLVGIIDGNKKKVAIFQNPNGSFFIVKEKSPLTSDLVLKTVKSDFVVIEDTSKKDTEYQVFFNNLVKPIKDN